MAERIPLLTEAVKLVGHVQIRTRGTVGGSVAHADPAAELPVAFAAHLGGAAFGAPGNIQSDPRFGDIRVASAPMGQAAPLAIASPVDPIAGTRSGDIVFNAAQTFGTGAWQWPCATRSAGSPAPNGGRPVSNVK